MKARYLLVGTGMVGIIGMATALGVIGVGNNDNHKIINEKKQELNSIIYPVIPDESRVLSSPSGPAFPSPGYEN